MSKRLLSFLNKQKGFFSHGNKIRFTVHIGHRESALLYCLQEKASETIAEKLENNLAALASSLEWDGHGRFWFDDATLLLNLATHNRFLLAQEAHFLEYEYYESLNYPFVIIKGPVDASQRFIPVTYHDDGRVTIGEGNDRLVAHNFIDEDTRILLKMFPTTVNF